MKEYLEVLDEDTFNLKLANALKSYGGFLMIMYTMYIAYLVLVLKGRKIVEWFGKKFGRKEDESDTSDTSDLYEF